MCLFFLGDGNVNRFLGDWFFSFLFTSVRSAFVAMVVFICMMGWMRDKLHSKLCLRRMCTLLTGKRNAANYQYHVSSSVCRIYQARHIRRVGGAHFFLSFCALACVSNMYYMRTCLNTYGLRCCYIWCSSKTHKPKIKKPREN